MKTVQRRRFRYLLGIACLASFHAVHADDAQRVIEDRIAGFRDMGSAAKNIGDQLKAARPDLTKIQMGVSAINDYRHALPNWFPPGSQAPPAQPKGWFDWLCRWWSCGGGYQLQTIESRAKPEIWKQPERFAAALRQFDGAADGLWRASKGGDIAAIRSEFKKVEGSCKNCHDPFREKED
jgi:cytochrome c556